MSRSLKDRGLLSEINLKDAEKELKLAEAEFRRSEASKNDIISTNEEYEKKLRAIDTLSDLLSCESGGLFSDTKGDPIIEDELDREIIRKKIIELVKKL